jgi:hypothetical protein
VWNGKINPGKAFDLTLPCGHVAEGYRAIKALLSVAAGHALYVCGYNGTESRWYRAALRQNAGSIIAAGMTKEVAFQPVGGSVNDSIDDA